MAPKTLAAICGLMFGLTLSVWLFAGVLTRMWSSDGRETSENDVSQTVQASPAPLIEPLPDDAIPVPFHEDFSEVREGDLPKGWLASDPLIGVRKDGGNSWVQHSGTGKGRLVSPAIAFPEDFQVDVFVWNSATLNVSLLSPSGVPTDLDFGCKSRGGVGVSFRLKSESVDSGIIHKQLTRIRLVKDGKMLRLIVGNEVKGTDFWPHQYQFGKIAFEIEHFNIPTAIEGMSVDRLSDRTQDQAR